MCNRNTFHTMKTNINSEGYGNNTNITTTVVAMEKKSDNNNKCQK